MNLSPSLLLGFLAGCGVPNMTGAIEEKPVRTTPEEMASGRAESVSFEAVEACRREMASREGTATVKLRVKRDARMVEVVVKGPEGDHKLARCVVGRLEGVRLKSWLNDPIEELAEELTLELAFGDDRAKHRARRVLDQAFVASVAGCQEHRADHAPLMGRGELSEAGDIETFELLAETPARFATCLREAFMQTHLTADPSRGTLSFSVASDVPE